MNKSTSPITVLLIVVVAILGLPVVLGIIRGKAPTPGVFDAGYTLTQARELSAESGKPMLVVVTADWCPPCQTLKRSTLMNPEVIAWIQSNAIPVYLEDSANPDEIGSLPVSSFPTTFLIQDDQILGSLPGAIGANKYIKSLESITPNPS